MKKAIVLISVIALILSSSNIFSQTKRALIVGIDVYNPANEQLASSRGEWGNLDGCVNDAKAISDIITSRFGFENNNIKSLFNQEASRDAIIKEIENLIDKAQKGDVIFIYYAGHGSQVYNSLSTEVDKQDESIVPANMIDIRDKELAVLYNKLLDKGVILTLIFDSCHSGSVARGNSLPSDFKTRHIDGSEIDSKDASKPQSPEDRGALVLSAAQPEQLAKEARDDNGSPHGAFTVALIKALDQSPVGESSDMFFLRIKAIMQANGSNQEPVLGANDIRKKQGLFGDDVSANSGKTIVAVLKVTGADNIELQGGFAIGLNKGCELVKVSDPTQSILITDVSGLSKSKAKIAAGDISKIKSGDIFQITKWANADVPNLRVWFPAYSSGISEINKIAKNLSVLENDKNIIWIADPTKEAPDYVVQYFNNTWKLSSPDGKIKDLGANISADLILKNIQKNKKLFIQLPPSKELVQALKIGKASENDAIDITKDPLKAQYILIGRIENGKIQYSLIRPNLSLGDTTGQSTLPLRTDWQNANDTSEIRLAGNTLTENAITLGKINAWLTLDSPPDNGAFPFYLALKNLSTSKYVISGTVKEDEKYSLALITDKAKLKKWNNKSRYIYVFVIDNEGKTQQVFPPKNTGNEGNKLPTKLYEYEEEIALGDASFTIFPPFGIDSYFMISSEEPINNFQAFNNSGVVNWRSRGGGSLDNLLNGVGMASRSISANTVPVTWSMQRLSIKSIAK
jgi:hypothetical protein